jgi:hypothetical protein
MPKSIYAFGGCGVYCSGKRTLIHVPRKKNAGGLQFTFEIGSQSPPEVLRVEVINVPRYLNLFK